MTNVNHSVNLIDEDCRNTIESEDAVSASATEASQGRKRHAKIRHSLPHIAGKSTEDRPTSRSNLLTAE
eukprot:11317975-Ditylum_brightwellii.AAC.1